MQINLLFLSVLSFLFSYLILYFFRSKFNKYFLDRPNSRSSHKTPKPSGGGVAFVSSFCLFSTLLGNNLPLIYIPLAFAGFLDDLFDINRVFRYFTQVITSILIIYNSHLLKNYLLSINFAFSFLSLIGLIIFITSIINFINFMDGIDGIVCSCLIIVFVVSSILINPYLSLLVGALFGFLFWNWPPSKIFMGDVGSTFLGAILSGTIIQQDSFDNFLRVIIVASPLLIDAFICVIRRFFEKQPIFKSHSLHLYQRLYQAGWTHSKVTICYLIPTFVLGLLAIYGSLNTLIYAFISLIIFGIYLDIKFSVRFKISLKNSKNKLFPSSIE